MNFNYRDAICRSIHYGCELSEPSWCLCTKAMAKARTLRILNRYLGEITFPLWFGIVVTLDTNPDRQELVGCLDFGVSSITNGVPMCFHRSQGYARDGNEREPNVRRGARL